MAPNWKAKAASASSSNASALGSATNRAMRSTSTPAILARAAPLLDCARMAETLPYRKKIEVDKPTRLKAPRQLAIIDQTGCTGCEACIAFCPVDCIEVVPGPQHPDFMKLVEVDLERCIGCQLCARYCPWETIVMWSHDEGMAVAPKYTVRSILYDYEPEEMHPAAETRTAAP